MSNSSTTTPPTSPVTDIDHENENENTTMTVFKVSNQMVTRRFTMSTERPTWTELESKVREVFSVPSSVFLGLAYVDKENDVVTLSSQAELEDFYNQVKDYDLSSGYKFTLVIFTPIREHDGGDYDDSSPGYEEQGGRNICPTQ